MINSTGALCANINDLTNKLFSCRGFKFSPYSRVSNVNISIVFLSVALRGVNIMIDDNCFPSSLEFMFLRWIKNVRKS